jgi:hypothetical protein
VSFLYFYVNPEFKRTRVTEIGKEKSVPQAVFTPLVHAQPGDECDNCVWTPHITNLKRLLIFPVQNFYFTSITRVSFPFWTRETRGLNIGLEIRYNNQHLLWVSSVYPGNTGILSYSNYTTGYAVAQLVEALRYEPKGRRFDSRWSHWNFSVT